MSDITHKPVRYLNELARLSWDLCLIFDSEGRLLEANPAAKSMFSFPSSSDRPMFWDLLQKQVGSLFKEVQETLRFKDIYKGRAHAVLYEGERIPIKLRASLSKDEPEACILVMCKTELEDQSPHNAVNLSRLTYEAGVGQVTTGLLHNIGNVLNGVNISVQSLATIARESKIPKLLKANALFKDNLDSLQEYVEKDPAGKYLPDFYENVGAHLQEEHQLVFAEIADLQEQVALIKEMISTQQDYARPHSPKRTIHLASLLKDSLKIELVSFRKHDIEIDIICPTDLYIHADKSKVLHVLLNLIKNAKESMVTSSEKEPYLKLVAKEEGEHIKLDVIDNGLGISASHLERMFRFGFTTKLDGHGFGLYSCQQSMREMGGDIQASSDGLGKGACFTIWFSKTPIES